MLNNHPYTKEKFKKIVNYPLKLCVCVHQLCVCISVGLCAFLYMCILGNCSMTKLPSHSQLISPQQRPKPHSLCRRRQEEVDVDLVPLERNNCSAQEVKNNCVRQTNKQNLRENLVQDTSQHINTQRYSICALWVETKAL